MILRNTTAAEANKQTHFRDLYNDIDTQGVK